MARLQKDSPEQVVESRTPRLRLVQPALENIISEDLYLEELNVCAVD